MGLFNLLSSSISGEKLSDTELNTYTSEQLHNLFRLAHKHDVVHLLAHSVRLNGLTERVSLDVEKCVLKAIFRYEKMRSDYETLCLALEKAEIPFMPLKGSVLRRYYPEKWMRTSCDIDVLVHADDCERAMAVLTAEYGYTYKEKSSHDVSLYSPAGVHVELHYDLLEEGRIGLSSKVLMKTWENATVCEGFSYRYEMTDEMFYFYHIAHMAKHFEEGGCGIRPFIDLKILDGVNTENVETRNKLLAEGGLLKFADSARRLSKIWFDSEKHDSVTRQMENFILRGGAYGSLENHIMIKQEKKGGRIRYILSKIFLPYSKLKFHYPILEKHRWLTPFMEIRRWFKLIFRGHLKRSAKEIKYTGSISGSKSEGIKIFLESIGL